MQCVQTRSRVEAGGSHNDVVSQTVVKSLDMHAHLPILIEHQLLE